ncbi:MAG: YIP1 family protein [Candidatus Bathyarchaeia archaeon]
MRRGVEEGFKARARRWIGSRSRWSIKVLFKPYEIYDEIFEEPDYLWILLLFVLTGLSAGLSYTLLQATKIVYYDLEADVRFTFVDVYGWLITALMNFFSNTINLGVNFILTAVVLYLSSWLLGGERNFSGTILCVGFSFAAYIISASLQTSIIPFVPDVTYRIASRVEVLMLLSSIQAMKRQIAIWNSLDRLNILADEVWRDSLVVQASNIVFYVFPVWVITVSGIGVGKLAELDRGRTLIMQGITVLVWMIVYVTLPRILG